MKRKFTETTEIEICRLYFEDRLSSIKLAERFLCPPSTIKRLINRNGFKLRSSGEDSEGGFGAKNRNWKGGRKRHGDGYILILRSNHPNADTKGYVLEHRLVMEKHLDRFLNPEEIVHHINGVKDDNRIENLMLFKEDGDHRIWHKRKRQGTKLLQKDFCVSSL